MVFYIKVKNDKISDIKFQTFGCVVAIAVSSALTTMVKGKSLKYAIDVTNRDILKKLGKVPNIKVHCSVLAADALHEAVYNYLEKNKKDIPAKLEKEHMRIRKTFEKMAKGKRKNAKLEEEILNKF